MTIDEMIAVLRAYKEGKQIDVRWKDRIKHTDDWDDDRKPCWNFQDYDYRIAPKQTKKIRLKAWLDISGELRLYIPNTIETTCWKRVPSEDKEITIEE